ncbi:hypothetical protein GVN16_03315 [Emticicia sp. CRIBPO]|uniref:hypothetical protein n=1 Tax=Emticicia sp. CRIBPO TaxID=2683258 RepID=UPI00141297CB|nr:hypothetical protein [Emticicia sp. CRIBPO]NBA84769.1 hypothetical protein [Emticicia sp. CRIBPO]
MKYQLIISIILCFSFCTSSFAQDKKIVNRMVVLGSKYNDDNNSDYYRGGSHFLTLYIYQENVVVFANETIVSSDTLASYGQIFDFEVKRTKEPLKSNYSFKWMYRNTYDDIRGTARVSLDFIYSKKGMLFKCIMVLENLDKYEYTGYVEGTADISSYFK